MADTIRKDRFSSQNLKNLREQVAELDVGKGLALNQEQRSARLRGILQAIRQINQSLVEDGDTSELVQGICRILNKHCSYHNVWITLVDPSGNALARFGSETAKDKGVPGRQQKLTAMPQCAQRALERHKQSPDSGQGSACKGCPLSSTESDRLARCVCLSNSNIIYGMLTVFGSEGSVDDVEERQLLEELAANLALALHNHAKKSMLTKGPFEMAERELYLRQVFETAMEGVALCEITYDRKKNPVDYFIRDINPAFLAHYNAQYSAVVDKPASQFFQQPQPPNLDIFARVAETGELTWFEHYYPPLQKYFSISVFSPKKGWFTTVIDDISLKKKYISANI